MIENELTEFNSFAHFTQKLNDLDRIKKDLKKGQLPQQIINFSDETMHKLYEICLKLFEEKSFKDAANSFLFLATLNPHHAGYWLGLGMATQMCHDYETAIDAYELAACLEIANPVPYFYLGKCYFAIHELENSLQALNLAIEIASEFEEYQELREQAETAKDLLLDHF